MLFRIILFLAAALFLSAGICLADGGGESSPVYDEAAWNSFKSSCSDSIIQSIKRTKHTKSRIYNFYLTKYTSKDINPVRDAVAAINPSYSPSQTMDAVYEVLSYRHIIFHETKWHNLEDNVSVISAYKDLIRNMASKHGIPAEVPLAVMTWENSGGLSKMSYAACGGLGQMSEAAVSRAHSHSAEKARALKKKASECSDPEEKKLLLKKAESFNIKARHARIAKQKRIKDERMIPECNAEDSVVYLSFLLECFDNRPDLAISAYHNGVMNNDDLIKCLMREKHVFGTETLTGFISKWNVTYLSLWNNRKTRDMLNGYLTMEGERTNASNRHDALGDESDLYPWKIFGAYSALIDDPANLKARIEACSGSVEETETRGLESFNSIQEADKGVRNGKLIMQNHKSGKKTVKIYLAPELAGFIKRVHGRLIKETGAKKIYIPAYNFMSAEYFEKKDIDRLHLKGIACDFNMKKFKYADKLRSILKHEWLNDRIYMRTEGDITHVCINPRYGLEFLNGYSR